ncbi:MAG: hypothetical protein IIU58_05675, partial [Clostridia bacterium]|nr:hypothetical protein [Clostridia bacterium]
MIEQNEKKSAAVSAETTQKTKKRGYANAQPRRKKAKPAAEQPVKAAQPLAASAPEAKKAVARPRKNGGRGKKQPVITSKLHIASLGGLH